MALMVLASLFALALYKNGPQGGDKLANSAKGLYELVLDKWRIDELYQMCIIEPLKSLGSWFFRAGDGAVIEGIVNEGPRGVYLVTSVFSDLQSGLMRSYLKLMYIGVLILAVWLIW